MVGWHHQFNGHELEQPLEGGEGQGSLVCCSPWGHKELDMGGRLNNKSNEHTETYCPIHLHWMNFIVCNCTSIKPFQKEKNEEQEEKGEENTKGRHIVSLCGDRTKFILCCPILKNYN